MVRWQRPWSGREVLFLLIELVVAAVVADALSVVLPYGALEVGAMIVIMVVLRRCRQRWWAGRRWGRRHSPR